MPGSSPVRHRAALLALTLFASLLSCGREITGPGGRGIPLALQFVPDFRPMMVEEVDGTMHSVAGLVPFTRVRIELRRSDNTVAASSVVEFPADADSIPLNILVPLSSDAGTEGEVLNAFLRYINAAGDTVFAGGPVSVLARRDRNVSPPPVVVPLAPTVPGATFARIDVSPDTAEANSGQSVTFTATGYDNQDVVVPNAIIGFLSRNPALAAVPSLASGTVNLVGPRGSTWIIAQSLTGVRDSAYVKILPVPSAIVKASGDGQSALTGAAFAQKLRVRVIASDALGVAGRTVNFAVTSGGGSVSEPSVVTDVDGFAEVTWTAGATAGAGTVTASVTAPALNVVFNGTQVASAASSLTFESQPTNITGGDLLPVINVAVRNGANQIITTFGGPVTLNLSGGPGGAALVGTTTVNAVEGVATFPDLTVNKGGTGYRLVAMHEQLPPAQSNLFDVAAPPPVSATLVSGGGQSAPANTQLADSIRVRFTDTFENPVAGATVTFTIQSGGGSLSPTTAITDIDGRVGVAWTLGELGAQQMRAAIGGVGLNVNATLVASEGISLFAGFDYTYVPIGGSRGIPIYLTNPSPTAVTVTLSVDEPIAQWSSSTVNIPAGQTVVTPALNGLAEGVTWVRMSSAVGDDSVLVTVVQSSVGLLTPQDSYFETGDTLRLLVQLTSPAGPGGVVVTVQSTQPSLALVAAGTGAGRPVEACVSSYYCYGGGALRSGDVGSSSSGPMGIIGEPSESVEILIPEGQVFGNLTVVIADDSEEQGWFGLDISAPNHAGQYTELAAYRPYLNLYFLDYYYGTTLGSGQYFRLMAQIANRSPAKGERVVTFTSRNPSIASVPAEARLGATDWASPVFQVRGVSEGTTYVVYSAPGMDSDSIEVTVTAPMLRISSDVGTYLPQQSRSRLSVGLSPTTTTSTFWMSEPVTVHWRTDNPAVVLLEQETSIIPAGSATASITFQTIGPGAGWVVAEIDGIAADSVEVWTYTASPTTFTPSLGGGVGLITPVNISIPNVIGDNGMRTLTLTSLNVGIARLLTPTLQAGGGNSNVTAYILGTGIGSTTIQVTGPGLATLNLSFNATRPATLVNTATLLPVDSIVRSAAGLLSDGFTARAPYDTVKARLRSSDPAVIEVTDSIVAFVPWTGHTSSQGKYRPVGPGTARLRLVPESAGMDSSLSALITVQAYTLSAYAYSSVVGLRTRSTFELYRNGPPQASLPVGVARTGPGEVEVVDFNGAFNPGASSAIGYAIGRSVGFDSLVFTVDGYNADTAVFQVVPSETKLQLYGYPSAGQLLTGIEALVTEQGGYTYRQAGEHITLRLRSLTEETAAVELDSIVFPPGNSYPSHTASVRFLQTGLARLVLEDVDGIILPDTVELYVEPRALTGGYYTNDTYDRVAIGMQQRTDDYDVYVTRGYSSPEPLWVHLTSSNPSLVQVADSVLIPAYGDYAYIVVTAGDSVGSARVIASAPGYNEYELDVIVTRGEISTYVYQSAAGFPVRTEAYVMDALTRSTRISTVPLPMRFSTDRNDLLDTAGTAFTYPSGSYWLDVAGPMALATGGALLRVEDDRAPGFTTLLPAARSLEISEALVGFSGPDVLRLTPGTRQVNAYSVFSSLDAEPVSGTATSKSGRFAVSPTAFDLNVGGQYDLQTAYYSSTTLEFRGLTTGADTLVLAADGHRPDTTLVFVEAGELVLEQGRQAMVVGDSVLVTLRLYDASRSHVAVTDATTFSFAADTTIVVSNGATAVSSIVLGEDAETLSFWVSSTQAGVFTLTITSPNFRTYQLPLQAVERP